MIAKMAGYAFRLRSSSYGGQVGSSPPYELNFSRRFLLEAAAFLLAIPPSASAVLHMFEYLSKIAHVEPLAANRAFHDVVGAVVVRLAFCSLSVCSHTSFHDPQPVTC
jgi:hypothetical protein